MGKKFKKGKNIYDFSRKNAVKNSKNWERGGVKGRLGFFQPPSLSLRQYPKVIRFFYGCLPSGKMQVKQSPNAMHMWRKVIDVN